MTFFFVKSYIATYNNSNVNASVDDLNQFQIRHVTSRNFSITICSLANST